MHEITQPNSLWIASLWPRVRPLFWVKALGTTAFMFVFFSAYLHLLKNPLYAVTVMPLTPVDSLVGFQPAALPLYASLWVYASLPPALLTTWRELIGYGIAIGSLCIVGLVCFMLFPTAVPVADINWDLYPGFGMLKGVDAAGNACPSLHVASAVFSAVWLHRLLVEMKADRVSVACNALWCAGIAYSTLATKQHVALDVIAGLMLGWSGAWLSLRILRPAGIRSAHH